MQYLGDFAEDATVYIPFNTFSSDDPQASVTITNLVDADIKVHKDGSATQIVTDGATVAIDFDTITGNHLITIDTSASADYAIGSDYMVRIEGTTVDAGTINAWVGSFSIENRFNEVDVVSLAGVVQSLTDLKDFADAGYDPATNKVQGVVLVDTNADMRGTDSAALAATALSTANWTTARAGYLDELSSANIPQDLIDIQGATFSSATDSLEAIRDSTKTSGDLAGLIATAQSDLDTITGIDGVTLAGTQPNSLSLQPITITAGDAVNNITLAGSGTSDGVAFTRSGSGDPFDTNFITQIQSGVATEAKQDVIDTNVDSILVDTGTTIPAQITALNDLSLSDVLTTQMTESYAADGSAPTLTQALMAIQQMLGDFSISGTTITVKKVDGSTTAFTSTLDSATAPITSRTRS